MSVKGRVKPFSERYTPIPVTGCWLWLAGIDSDGYGLMTGNRKGHRISYELHYGPIPPWMCVCHSCDVRCCVNPDHLFLATSPGNTADKVKKGRQARGETQAASKLKESDVRNIRASTASASSLARQLGVTTRVVSLVRRNLAWTHVK